VVSPVGEGRRTVVVAGSLNLDLRIAVDRLPRPGETVSALRPARTEIGGKGANLAVAAGRLTADVVLLSTIGDDAGGEAAIRMLRDQPVHTRFEISRGSPTGQAVVTVDAKGENAIVVVPGANREPLTRIPDDLLVRGNLLVQQLEEPIVVVADRAEEARRSGLLVVTNASPAPEPSADLSRLLRATDVLIVNEIEATQLSAAAGTPFGARGLRALGPEVVVVTRGGAGIEAASSRGDEFVAAFRAAPIDTTGAGDACAAGIVTGLAEGLPLTDCLILGAAAGAAAVGRAGTIASFGSRDEIDQVIAQSPR